MTAQPEFLPVHHLALNCAAFICLQVMADDDRMALMLATLTEAMATAPRDTALRARLCEVGDGLIRHQQARHGLEWAHARLQAGSRLANLFFWRAGLADAATKGDDNAA